MTGLFRLRPVGDKSGTKKWRSAAAAVLLLFAQGALSDLGAFDYAFHNRTDYLVSVAVRFYDGEERTLEMEAKKSRRISAPLLLKNWTAQAYFVDHWETVLELTCDFLPMNHAFSLFVDEGAGRRGNPRGLWYATNE
jgi:hypothetical protein